MTEKLYYKDAYIKEFSATVLSSVKAEDGYAVTLDRRAVSILIADISERQELCLSVKTGE